MTAQIPDTVTFDGVEYAITAVDGSGLFEPSAFGWRPTLLSTGCWRGFFCSYAIADGVLVVRDVTVAATDSPAAIHGVVATRGQDREWHYRYLDLTVEFTGRLLIARNVVPNRPYLNMGFAPAWLFAEVWDLAFETGVLAKAKDRSADLAAVRERLGAEGAKPRDGETVSDWVTATFSLSYDYSWPGRSVE